MMFRILYAMIHATLIISLSGIPRTALAAVSCQDQINPNTTIRYSDTLVSFVSYNGKTYAIAKSAATGGTSEAETFFDFSANITRAYTMTGDSTGSLKNLLSLGKFGAAKPVKIDSADTEKFILTQYGKYLGSASTPKSTYLDAWKEYGASGFTTVDGSALSYTNWASPVYSGQDPQAVVMGGDGKWTSGLDGTRSGQIVQFDGVLDCAASFSPPQTGDGTTTTPPTTRTSGPDLSKPVCGQDLNNNGYAADLGEIANCIQTTQGLFCPVGSVNCVETYSAPICPSGSALNTSRDMCQADAVVTCGSGYSYDPSLDKCVRSIDCPENGLFNPVTDRCEKLVQNDCPTGYSYDGNSSSPTYDRCVKSATCNDGGSFIASSDRCERAWMPVCDSANGYSYNSATGQCQRSPVCSSGSYNPAYDLCTKQYAISCPSGYNYSATTGRCEMQPVCPSGTSFNSITNRCETSATTITGYTQPITGKTEIIKYKARGNTSTGITQYSTSPLALDSLSFDFILQNGQVVLKKECAWGGAGNCGCDRPHWNGWCRAGTDLTQTRNGNTLTVVATIFDWNYDYYSPYCDPGYTLFYDYDSGSPYCMGCPTQAYDWESGSYYTYYSCSGEVRYPASKSYTTGAAASADLSEFVSCPAGYTLTSPPSASTCTTIVSQWGVQTGITDCTQSGLYTCSAPVNACVAGYTLSGSVCYQNPTCPSGSFDSTTHTCYAPASLLCDDGFRLDTAANTCVKSPSCPGGVLNTGTDVCEATVTKDCGTYAFDSGANVCYSAPVCSAGVYDATFNLCLGALTRNCGSYAWSQPDFKCLQAVSCPKPDGFSQSSSVAFSSSLDRCVSEAQHDCPAGTAYNGLPVEKCEAVPICTGDGIYNTTVHSCFLGMNTCPLGTQYTCMDNNGTMQCSPNQCFTAGTSGTEETTVMDESMMQDDGQRDENGNCLDQLFVFNGKSSRCRPPGLTVGMINNCCESDSVGTDDMGSNISMVANGIQTAYEIGQVAYYSNLVTSGAATLTPLVGTTSVGIVTATGTTTVSGAVATGVSTAAASGTTGAAAIGSGLQAYVGALLNPATIAVAIVVMVVMKVLMGSGCDQGDIQTGMQAAAKDCHYIGDYCEKKWPLVGCVQKAKGYCCFNTKMARIIHEQGRPQLLSFGTDGAWGTPSSPNCRGFTPDEFQSLDFSRIDLSEYFGDIQKDLAMKIQGAQTSIQNRVEQKFQATTGAN
ncbi:conjugal transfer protein TraN [Geomesophilobacter sediminis]|uniref:Conjugal transfer protein TraN n=1 Tax=Geomesophilobacter sediminis TaxID=2798584 RepID=A0A8J7JF82_9BACT|nr:conjugal transfer protein TraN [Geomesophilobacter sediminis]MBJ6724899.1 conjugal transfer protein TraN [Geomesophilobacter sediminis]